MMQNSLNIFNLEYKKTHRNVENFKENPNAKKNYYDNFRKIPYNKYRGEILKYLFENGIIDYNFSIINPKIELEINESYKNGINIDDFIKKYKK